MHTLISKEIGVLVILTLESIALLCSCIRWPGRIRWRNVVCLGSLTRVTRWGFGAACRPRNIPFAGQVRRLCRRTWPARNGSWRALARQTSH